MIRKESIQSNIAPRPVAPALRVSLLGFVAGILVLTSSDAFALQDLNLAWNPSPSANVAGYTLRFGTNSGSYFDFLVLGTETAATVFDLEEGVTYYFSVSAYTAAGFESDPSNELSYRVPDGTVINVPPVLDALPNLTLTTNAGTQVVALTGIGSGSATEVQLLRVSAMSSNPYLVSTPSVLYSSPVSTGIISFTPLGNRTGSATITVTVDDGQTANNLFTRSFTVTVIEGIAQAQALFIEAESGITVAPMVVALDTNASNGRYIYSLTNNQGLLTFPINITRTDDYIVWCRVLSVDNSTDSFFLSVDGQAEDVFRTAQNNSWSSKWQWIRVTTLADNTVRHFPMTVGQHTLSFRGREASTLLDAMYITNDPDFAPVKLSVVPVTSPTRGAKVAFQSAPGYQYELLATEDFKAWVSLWSSSSVTSNQVFTYTDTAQTASRARFYRVQLH